MEPGEWDTRVSGYFVKETDGHLVHVLPMIFNHRVVVTPKSNLNCWVDAWCYDGYGDAMAAALLWDPETETEPRGWKKHPLSGRRNDGRDQEREELEVRELPAGTAQG